MTYKKDPEKLLEQISSDLKSLLEATQGSGFDDKIRETVRETIGESIPSHDSDASDFFDSSDEYSSDLNKINRQLGLTESVYKALEKLPKASASFETAFAKYLKKYNYDNNWNLDYEMCVRAGVWALSTFASKLAKEVTGFSHKSDMQDELRIGYEALEELKDRFGNKVLSSFTDNNKSAFYKIAEKINEDNDMNNRLEKVLLTMYTLGYDSNKTFKDFIEDLRLSSSFHNYVVESVTRYTG